LLGQPGEVLSEGSDRLSIARLSITKGLTWSELQCRQSIVWVYAALLILQQQKCNLELQWNLILGQIPEEQ